MLPSVFSEESAVVVCGYCRFDITTREKINCAIVLVLFCLVHTTTEFNRSNNYNYDSYNLG